MAGKEKRLSFEEVYQVLERIVSDDAVERRKVMNHFLKGKLKYIHDRRGRVLLANDQYHGHLFLVRGIRSALFHIAEEYGVRKYKEILTKVKEIRE